jgi:hypothetical protein
MATSITKSRKLMMAAVFAALYFVLRSLPNPIPFLFQMIGISGRFTAGDFLLTTVVLFAGLWSGTLSVFIGTILAYPLNPPLFLGLDFLPGVMNVAVTGLVLKNHLNLARGLYVLILGAFILSPYSLTFGYMYIPYTWLHIVALVVLISPITAKAPKLMMRNGMRQVLTMGALAFVGTMTQHLTGGLLYELTIGLVQGNSPAILAKSWQVIFWLYPTERLVLTVISTVISTGLLRAFKRLPA